MYITLKITTNKSRKDYKVDVFLRMSWQDPRLKFMGNTNQSLTLVPALVDDIWMPDLFFANAKKGFKHEVIEKSTYSKLFESQLF